VSDGGLPLPADWIDVNIAFNSECYIVTTKDQLRGAQKQAGRPKRDRRKWEDKSMIREVWWAVAAALVLSPGAALAQKAYDAGASDTEIKLGQTMPFSGPVSAAGTVGTASIAYFEAINKAGGINGRKITLISSDDAYSPPKTVEVTRKLVESDEVLFVYGSVGTPTNASVQKYFNAKKVPQLFVATGASRFKDPKTAPWTTSLLPGYDAEGKALARYVLETVADPKIASDAAELAARCIRLDAARAETERLYARWAELEAKRTT
jgi:ABC-type branched-subunit amino acid transport system substrate-binding protein